MDVGILIIGAGVAGSSTAWHLADLRIRDVVVIERESLPGMHASSQGSNILRQFIDDLTLARVAFKGGGFLLTPPFHWGKIVDPVGSLILFPMHSKKGVLPSFNACTSMGLEASLITKKDAIAKVPILEDAEFDEAIWTSTDGVIDNQRLLWSYINDAKTAGVRFKMGEEVIDIKVLEGGFLVSTTKDTYRAKKVVNAGGAWAGEIGKMVGRDIGLVSYKRHLYNTAVMHGVDPSWPVVWDIANGYYFRYDSGGLAISPCDEERATPGIPAISVSARQMLAQKLSNYCPRLANISIYSEGAGLTVLAPDRRFVLGRDNIVNGFYWAAALGWYGISCSSEVGKMVARDIAGKMDVPLEFNVARFG